MLILLASATPLMAGDAPWIAKPGRDRTWHSEHQKLVQRARKGDVSIYLLGDSITAHWTSTGRAIWHLDLLPLKSACFGVSADRVENILYRITHGGLPEVGPKLYVLMLGTNNLAQSEANEPAEVVRGIKTVVATIRKRHPSSKILLLSILPNGKDPEHKLRKTILATNRQLATLDDGDSIHYADVHDQFLGKDGKWLAGLTSDGTHLTSRGYERPYSLIRKPLHQLSRGRLPAAEDH